MWLMAITLADMVWRSSFQLMFCISMCSRTFRWGVKYIFCVQMSLVNFRMTKLKSKLQSFSESLICKHPAPQEGVWYAL